MRPCLAVLADIESAQARNKSHDEIRKLIGTDRAKAYGLYLSSDSAKAADVEAERRKDLYSHFVLRLAFCRSSVSRGYLAWAARGATLMTWAFFNSRSEELRQRFVRAETTLFKIRFETDDLVERRRFVDSLQFGWEVVSRRATLCWQSQSLIQHLDTLVRSMNKRSINIERSFVWRQEASSPTSSLWSSSSRCVLV